MRAVCGIKNDHSSFPTQGIIRHILTDASVLSFGFTALDDIFNNGGWGENSATSLTTLIAGQLPLSPSWDLAVDTYASGYNHGFFNGIYTFGSNGLLKP